MPLQLAPLVPAALAAASRALAAKEAIDTGVDTALDIKKWFEEPPAPGESLESKVDQAIDAANAARSAAEAGGGDPQPGTFEYNHLTAILFGVRQSMGDVDFHLENNHEGRRFRNLIDIYEEAESARAAATSARSYVFEVLEYFEALQRGAGHYPLTAIGVEAFEEDVADGTVVGTGLIVSRLDETTGKRVPAINPKLLTLKSPSGDATYNMLEVILDALSGLPIFRL